MSDILPDDIQLIIISYYHSLSDLLIFRLINRSYNKKISYMKIRQIGLDKKIETIVVKFEISDREKILLPFGLLVEWNIALQKLTNGNQLIQYNKTINYIEKWAKFLKTLKEPEQLSILNAKAAIRWAIGQKMYNII
jgi:hypothetical protein